MESRAPGRIALADLVPAVVLVALGQLEVWVDGGIDGRTAAAIALLATVPLAWRTRTPLTVLLVSLAALCLLTLRGEDQFTVAQLLGLMLATYTVASRRPLKVAAGCTGLVLLAAMANSASAGSEEAGDYVFPVILLGVPAAAGYSLQQWRNRSEQLRLLTEELRAEREAHARLVVAAERGRIARDLHDSLAQSLNAVVVHAEAGAAALGLDEGRVASALTRIQQVGRSSLTETRQILGALRSDEVDPVGQPRLAQLDQLLKGFGTSGLTVSLSVEGEPRPTPSSVEAAAYRIVQESLNNVLRHSDATAARVTLRHGEELEVEVADDGPARHDGSTGGYGIRGMRERAHLLGGDLEAGAADNGWRVRARLPREAAS